MSSADAGERRHAEAGGHAQDAVAVEQRQRQLLDPCAHALGQVVGAVEVGAGEDDRELLAAVAGGLVDLARGLAQHPGHLAQDDVALLVAVGVVDVLEVVDVEQHERQRLAEALGALDLGRHHLLKRRRLERPVSSSVTAWRSTVSCRPTFSIETAACVAR